MIFKESHYNLKVDLLGGRALMFNSMSRSLALLEADDLEELSRATNVPQAETSELMGHLLSQGFLVKEETDELDILEGQYRQRRYDPGSVTLTVCPTLDCNFGCDYCFQGLDKSVQTMSPETQDGVIELYLNVLEKQPETQTLHMTWYGGEPLLKPKIIYNLSDRLLKINQERGINYTASMITNGSRLTRPVAMELYKRGLRKVQITLDGGKEDHDGRRHYLSNKGSYDRIIANIKSWVYDIPIAIDMRVNIDDRNMHGIEALIDDLENSGLGNLPNLQMYFAPVESVTPGCHSISDKMITKMKYGQLESKLIRYAYEKGLTGLPYPPSFMGLCSALRPYDFIVVPNGDIHKCWDTVSFQDKRIGHVSTQEHILKNRSPIKAKWDEFNPFDNSTCRSCKILPNCSSFCAHKFVNAGDTIGEASLPCPSLKYSINEKIVMRAEKEGFITKDDYDPEMIKTDPTALCSEVFVKENYL